MFRFPTGTKDFSPLRSFHTGLGPTQFYYLGAFTKFQKATVTFVMSVRPSGSLRGTTGPPNGRIFMRLYIYIHFFRKYVERIQVPLKSDKNYRFFTRRPVYIFFIISHSVFLRMRNVSDESCRENQNTRFIFNNFFLENCNIYVIMWKNI